MGVRRPRRRPPFGGATRWSSDPTIRAIYHITHVDNLAAMTIETGKGNLLTADVEALVNPVNTKGVMGKGLALQFKKAFPENFAEYERACRAGEVTTGRVHVVPRLASPRYIINFPTKNHWRQPSKLDYVREGMKDLLEHIQRLGIRSVAMPPLGCGNGGLDWRVVRPVIIDALSRRVREPIRNGASWHRPLGHAARRRR